MAQQHEDRMKAQERQAQLNAQAHAHMNAGQWAEAEKICAQILRSTPAQPETLNILAAIRAAQRHFEEAVTLMNRALAYAPHVADGYVTRSKYLQRLGRYEEALRDCDKALTLQAVSAPAHDNRAHCLVALARPEEAIAAFDAALTIVPNAVSVHYTRAMTLTRLGRYEEALAGFEQAIAVAPGTAVAHTGRGSVLQALGRQDEARASFDQALSLSPDSAVAQFNKATHSLLLGEYAQGWPLYEARSRIPENLHPRGLSQPQWTGAEDIRGKTILLHAEQGLGDILQFCRYVPMVEALGANVILEVPDTLRALMQTLRSFRLMTRGEDVPPHDLHCALLSLPRAFNTVLETIPNQMPYLAASPQSIAFWQQKLGAATRPRIGLVWSGKAGYSNDRNRSLDLASFAPLLTLDMEFHALQKERRDADAAFIQAGAPVTFHGPSLTDMDATAGLAMAMDLVISVDTSIAHLAGALARPVWVMLPYAPDFRWLLAREDSPWYPTARLIRQPTIGDWSSVIARVATMLKQGID